MINDPSILVSVKYIINILLNSLPLPTSEKSTVRSSPRPQKDRNYVFYKEDNLIVC